MNPGEIEFYMEGLTPPSMRCTYLPMKTTEYHMKDITALLGIKMSSLQPWLDRGYVSPSVERAQGPGTRNIWSREDMFRLAAFKVLLENGFRREEAAALIKDGPDNTLYGGLTISPGSLNYDLADALGFETFAVQIVDNAGNTHNLLVAACEPGCEASRREGSVFVMLQNIGKHLGLESFKSFRAVNITEAQRIVFG